MRPSSIQRNFLLRIIISATKYPKFNSKRKYKNIQSKKGYIFLQKQLLEPFQNITTIPQNNTSNSTCGRLMFLHMFSELAMNFYSHVKSMIMKLKIVMSYYDNSQYLMIYMIE